MSDPEGADAVPRRRRRHRRRRGARRAFLMFVLLAMGSIAGLIVVFLEIINAFGR